MPPTIKPRTRRTPKEPIGSPGTRISSGRVLEETNSALAGVNGINVYDEMWRVDAMIQACWLATMLPFVAADHYVDIGGKEGDGKRDKKFATKVADFTTEMLFERADRPFSEMLRESLMYRIWGFAPFERGLYMDEGQAWLKDVYLRHPRSILYSSEPWVLKGDRLLGIHQNDFYTEPRLASQKEIFLPRENLLLLTNQRVGANYEGLSSLRPCYRPYTAKKHLIQFALIGLEKQSMGTVVGKLAETFTTRRQTEMRETVRAVRGGEDAGVVLSAGENLEIIEGKIKSAELLEHIRFHNSEIATAWLASFLTLGQGSSGGGYAQSADLTDFFFVALDAVAGFVGEAWERDVIRPIIELNFGPQARKVCPKLRAHVARENKQAIADIWQKLVAGQIITVSEEDEDWLRKQMCLPPRTMPRPPPVDPNAPPGGAQPPSTTKKPAAGPAKQPSRPGNRTPAKS